MARYSSRQNCRANVTDKLVSSFINIYRMSKLKKLGMKLIIFVIISGLFSGCISQRQFKELTSGGYKYNKEKKYTYNTKYYYEIKKIDYKKDLKGKVREIEFQFLSKKITTSYYQMYNRRVDNPNLGHYISYRKYDQKTTYGNWEPLANTKISVNLLSSYFDIDNSKNLVTDSDGKIKVKVNVLYDNIYFSGVKENLKSLELDNKLFSNKYSEEETIDAFIIKYDTESFSQRFVVIDTNKSKDLIAQEIERSIQDKVDQIYAKKFNNINIIVEDIDTRYELKNPDITIQGKAPKIKNILKPFFKNKKHLDMAVNKFPTVVNGEKKGYKYTSFPLYIGGTYKVMIKHPLYNYTERKIKIKPNTQKIVIRMSELGTKHRVKVVNQ